MNTAQQIVSPQHNAPIMGCVQNGLFGSYLVTNRWKPETKRKEQESEKEWIARFTETMIDYEDFCDCIYASGIDTDRIMDLASRAQKFYPELVKKVKVKKINDDKKIITEEIFVFNKKPMPGKIMMSIVFPSNFMWSKKTNTNPHYPIVEISSGILTPTSGPLCKKVLGGVANGVVHILWKLYSPTIAQDFITEVHMLIGHYITRYGFSIGISDCVPISTEDAKKAIATAKVECAAILETDTTPDEREKNINSSLNKAISDMTNKQMNKDDHNALGIMRLAGAKGSQSNNDQISYVVGQQNLDGKRMPLLLSNGKRGLPHFKCGDQSPEARGFVEHSYLQGLSPAENWYHAAGGRRGVADTAMKSVTGDTPIFIFNPDTKLIWIKIGEWIDDFFSNEIFQTTQLLDISDKNFKIPSTDNHGYMGWYKISHVTRHIPTKKLYKITTKTGRKVTIADTKTLLVFNGYKLEERYASEISIGSLLPITFGLCSRTEKQEIEFSKLFKRTQQAEMDIIMITNTFQGKKTEYIDDHIYTLQTSPKILNDVFLDEVCKIEEIDTFSDKWVYDITVPETKNFMLANGLNVVDTADFRIMGIVLAY